MTRRAFVAASALAAAGAALGLQGCGTSGESERWSKSHTYYDVHLDDRHSEGMSVDTEYCDYDVSLTCLADEYLQWVKYNDEVFLDYLRDLYVDANPNVSIEIRYMAPDELESVCRSGCNADLIIADEPLIDAGVEAGVLYGGPATICTRKLTALNKKGNYGYYVRPVGSKKELPTDPEVIAEDPKYGYDLLNLEGWDGKMGICSADTHAGYLARRAFSYQKLFTGDWDEAGTFDSRISGALKEYKTLKGLAHGLETGEVDFAVMLKSDMCCCAEEYGVKLEELRETTGGSALDFWGASFKSAAEGGVARDFLQYVRTFG